jgi:hypothetical protein
MFVNLMPLSVAFFRCGRTLVKCQSVYEMEMES